LFSKEKSISTYQALCLILVTFRSDGSKYNDGDDKEIIKAQESQKRVASKVGNMEREEREDRNNRNTRENSESK